MSSLTASEQAEVAPTVTISVRVPRDIYEKLNEHARNDNRSISNWVNVLIAKSVNQE